MKLWNLFAPRDRKTDDEKVVTRYLLWEFRHSLECIAENMAHSQARQNAYPAPDTPWMHRASPMYWALDPHPDWPRRSSAILRKHTRHRKWLLARFQQQPVPSVCRNLALYRKKYLKLEMESLVGIDDHASLQDYANLQTERWEAMRTAGTERKQLHEQYRDAMLAESKSFQKWLPKKWEF